VNFLPISEAPYTRKYAHTASRGHETLVTCGYCGRQVPRYKTFVKYKGFRITDPVIKQKMYVCPSCARYHKVVQRGKSVQKKHRR